MGRDDPNILRPLTNLLPDGETRGQMYLNLDKFPYQGV